MHRLKPTRSALACLSLATSLLGPSLSTVRGATLARYDFDSLASSDTDATSIAGDITYDEVLGRGRFDTGGNPGGMLLFTTSYKTVDETKTYYGYVSATLTPAPGYALNLDTLSSDFAGANFGAGTYIPQLAVYTSLDNYANPIHFNLATANSGTSTVPTVGAFSSITSPGMSFNPSVYHNVTVPVEFRFYMFGNTVNAAVLDNIRISGTTALAPEPMGLSALGALALVGGRRRGRR